MKTQYQKPSTRIFQVRAESCLMAGSEVPTTPTATQILQLEYEEGEGDNLTLY